MLSVPVPVQKMNSCGIQDGRVSQKRFKNYFCPSTHPRHAVRTLAHTVSSHLSVCAVSDRGYVDCPTQKTNASSTRSAIDVALNDTGGVGQLLRILNELGANTTKCVHQFQSPLGIGRRRKHVAGL